MRVLTHSLSLRASQLYICIFGCFLESQTASLARKPLQTTFLKLSESALPFWVFGWEALRTFDSIALHHCTQLSDISCKTYEAPFSNTCQLYGVPVLLWENKAKRKWRNKVLNWSHEAEKVFFWLSENHMNIGSRSLKKITTVLPIE